MATWHQDMCGCFDNLETALLSYFVPCYLYGKSAEYTGKNCLLHGCLYLIPFVNITLRTINRYSIRNLQGIPGNCIDDFMATLFCGCCSLAQIGTEVELMKARDAESIPVAMEMVDMTTTFNHQEITRL